ncbi:MAG: aminodeoxychorismate synthase component I [Gammaproteobacteria bacterium]|nr:MAG: aminodeoxychorismate synthase component I [Gammaproteobacteria bacterium]
MPYSKPSFKSNGLKIYSQQGQQNLLALHQSNPQRYPFLLESVASSDSSHFDILFAFPQETLTLSNQNKLSGYTDIEGDDFLNNLSHWWQTKRDNSINCETLPFSGGWFLYLGYELAKQVEAHLKLKTPSTPIAYASRIPAAIIYDHNENCTYSICEEQFNYLEQLTSDIGQTDGKAGNSPLVSGKIQEEDEKQYLNSIKKVKQYIVDGDIFQANLSRLWKMQDCKASAVDLYKKLRKTNPAPFAGLAIHNDFSIISSSPERLISVKNGLAQTRPIAGTRKREKEKEKDEALKSELMSHPKERAEHIMLIDLERNDLGRICTPGTIKVDELMVLESYAHVHHIVSNVCGRLKDGILPGEVIKAVFPGGTITGCPKVRCMEIIAELETEARGAYTGSMGYLNHNGDMDINILIRTITLENNTLYFRAGAGLVADSVAQSELEETRHKARGLLLALQ